jgi:putative flippase GtrA
MAFTAPGSYSRVRTLLPELVRFCVVGGIGAVVDLGGAALLHGEFHVEPLAAKAISTSAATVITYLGSRFWTFKHRENQELKREAVLFIVLNLIGLLIAEVVVGFVTYVLGQHGQVAYNLASFLGTGLATVFRYFAYKKWVFLAPAERVEETTAPAAEAAPDYPPWDLDPTFLVRTDATAPAPATAPATATAEAPAPFRSSPWATETADRDQAPWATETADTDRPPWATETADTDRPPWATETGAGAPWATEAAADSPWARETAADPDRAVTVSWEALNSRTTPLPMAEPAAPAFPAPGSTPPGLTASGSGASGSGASGSTASGFPAASHLAPGQDTARSAPAAPGASTGTRPSGGRHRKS